ncbi:ATP synthase F1 subunit epsilon [Bacteroides sp.]|uniref:ATP synthase F1 subunit epsilon n=1 Tax=Bacteroides sp. TaxID=29523 RepID=UPI001B4B026E|nr:ATP synthase F1 subunit epsilon [Bacteroides sp.]MBP6065816.1 ATP synthase F1 subunit epsilon [Bacteroides sp.]MBP6066922.1 ATP synthase F1 subunit epsilon [Bacteroides sp.]MBP6936617.1 ATP synthase F1 subunit epsilon [Bacteroides sp.]MBP8622001.1 ATP synthase F1 subunit epsilon [Bacteroides sp.]MBP9507429.1 ATP synthase F1 subunit epsilon [Bacteroides sp.]
MKLSIVSPEKEIFNGEVKSVTLPGTMGTFSILPHHAPIVSSLKAGKVSYITVEGEEHTLDIHSGFVEMSNGEASVCVS